MRNRELLLIGGMLALGFYFGKRGGATVRKLNDDEQDELKNQATGKNVVQLQQPGKSK
jgi:cell division protein FtsB